MLDEENKLPELKFFPERHQRDDRYFYNKNNQRGRGRGRGHGSNYPRNAHRTGYTQVYGEAARSSKNTNSKTHPNVEEESWDVDTGKEQTAPRNETNDSSSSLNEKMKQLNVTDDKSNQEEVKQSKPETEAK